MFISTYILSNNKFYVNKSINPITNITDVQRNDWTTTNSVIYMNAQFPSNSFNETQTLYDIISEHGIIHVRGYDWTHSELSIKEINELLPKLNSFYINCHMCGDNTHITQECKYMLQVIKANKQRDKSISDGNKKCDCIASSLSSHRKKNCQISKTVSQIFDFAKVKLNQL
jgi:ABC-type glutathione transport system ATPase component